MPPSLQERESLLSCRAAALPVDAPVGVQEERTVTQGRHAGSQDYVFHFQSLKQYVYVLIFKHANSFNGYIPAMGLRSGFALTTRAGTKLGQAAVALPLLRITLPKALCPRGV